ncbi:restriction endonuclease subunit M, partial [Streptomyces sp. Wh19]|nr:restriction endonuclease subunit M [Streptomyces sp. Wh19]
MPENSTEVTAAGIARLAGVGRAAVSNWRRRHADFPKPVGGTETSPSFALSEVERWLRDQGKLAEVPLRERVWQQVAGHPAGAVPALVHTGCALLLLRTSPKAWPEIAAAPDERMADVLSLALDKVLTARFGPATEDGRAVHTAEDGRAVHTAEDGRAVHTAEDGRAVHTPSGTELLPSVPLLRAVAELAAGTGAGAGTGTGVGETFEFLLGRQLDANPRQYTLTPPELAELMAALVEAGERPARAVLDPAAGTGA